MSDSSDDKKSSNIVPPPPRRQQRGILAPVPKEERPVENMSRPNSGITDMNFKMDADFHRVFKLQATLRNMAMKELLEASFRCWVETYGDDMIKSMLPPK